MLAANTAAAKMHGYELEEFCDLDIEDLDPSQESNSFNKFSDIIWNGGLFETVAQHIRADSSLLYIEWRVVAYKYKGHNSALAILEGCKQKN